MAPPPSDDYDDIQAIVRSGFGALKEASFLLLQIVDPAEAKAWLGAASGGFANGTLSYRVTRAKDLDLHQPQALQIAFTAQGLRTLGVEDLLHAFPANDTFSREFYLGMAGPRCEAEGRPRRLGDVGANAPSYWEWGAQGQVPDALVMLYAEEGGIAAFRQEVIADLALGFEVVRVLNAADGPDDRIAQSAGDDDGKPRREPFGFVDGISQPAIDWAQTRRPGTRADLDYGNLIAPGEFLLGYKNEYGSYTRRPLLDPKLDPENILAEAEDRPGSRDLGRNGTYLVFRQLEQDVCGFWRFACSKSPADGGIGLAEAMVGRRLAAGDPLVAASCTEIRGVGPKARDIRQNNFTFDADPDGLACPFGAHIRRANPRTADLPGGRQSIVSWLLRMLGLKRGGPRNDLLSSSRFHRIVRRGRPYGPAIDREDALRGEDPGIASGLYFIALNANLSRQFEFIQNAWIANSKFNALDGESDPLLGNREATPLGLPTDGFSMPQPSGVACRIAGLPQFIAMRGGAYFFLPGLRALRFLARLGGTR